MAAASTIPSQRFVFLPQLSVSLVAWWYPFPASALFPRYLTYGSATAKAAALMAVPEVEDFFTRLIMRVAPKSYAQANGEVVVTRRFLENFSGEMN